MPCSPPSPPPRYATPRDPAAPTFGPAVATLAAAQRMPLMPWQHQVVDTALELIPDPDGPGLVYRYPVVLLTVPRQSGKTTVLEPVIQHRCLTVPDAGTWLTAQKRNDARDTWMRSVKRAQRGPLAPLVDVRTANGSESILWRNGSEVRLFAPSEDSLHGKSTDLVFVDEIWSFSEEQGRALMQAIVPTQATRRMAQTWLVSTAGTARSTWMRPMIDQARARLAEGRADSVAYFEWSIPEDCEDPSNIETICEYHPAYGHTITRRALQTARDAMDAAEFARAYGNFWVSSSGFYLAPAVWDAARTRDPMLTTPVAFAAEVAPDRSGGVIVAAGHLANGQAAVEMVEHRAGVGWIAPRLMELTARHKPVAVVVDPYGPARPVHAALVEQRRAFVPMVEQFGAADFVQADSEFVSGLVEGTVRHRAHERFDAAMVAAGTRQVREQTVISRVGHSESGHPTALVAALLALYGLRHPGERPARPEIRSS